ncbi:MAG TPA: PBP1A family penicillin-binding protein [Myxococcota bacterium]|nr:PBP1A family penicillin-binding protein [Myxococcota bacterium]
MKRWLLVTTVAAAFFTAAVLGSALARLLALELPSRRLDHGSRGPSRVYSRPLSLRVGATLDAAALEDQLRGAGYRRASEPQHPGEYARAGRRFTIDLRPFADAAGEEPGGVARVRIGGDGQVESLVDAAGEPLSERRVEGAAIGAFYPESGRDREPVRLDALPAHLVDAVLAIEDQRFFQHAGLDLRRTIGAMLSNLRAGHVVEGGSTLTQQLAKNLYLGRERTLWRKLQELPLALLLEWRLDKREILEAYCNEVYLGQAGGVAIHGIASAARHYFGVRPEQLTLAQSALLAGMLRGPMLYEPRRDPALARDRRDEVLSRMREQGRIDEAAYAAAVASPLGVLESWSPPASSRWFVDAVRSEIARRFPAVDLARDGWRFDTTLDLRLQRIAERAVADGVARAEDRSPKLRRDDSPLQAALVAMEPRTGELYAHVGGREYGSSQFDRAREAWRQPGSLFKPVAALAALSPDGAAPPRFTLATLLDDEPFSLDTPEGLWQPTNYDGTFRGPVTLRQAIEHSLNVPMVRLGQEIGPESIVRAARSLGIESPMRAVPSLVLGTSETTLLEMTRAYAVLAARGWHAQLRTLVGARDADGAIAQGLEPSGANAIDPALADLLTSALRGVVDRGTGASLRSRFTGPLAGKTGTTDDYRDAWFVGYTPTLVAGVWMGFDDGASLHQSASRAALPLFAEFAVGALGARGGRDFPPPQELEEIRVVASPGHPAGIRCGGEPELFLAGTGPTEGCQPFEWIDAGASGIRSFGEWLRERIPWPNLPPVGAGPPEPRVGETRPGAPR